MKNDLGKTLTYEIFSFNFFFDFSSTVRLKNDDEPPEHFYYSLFKSGCISKSDANFFKKCRFNPDRVLKACLNETPKRIRFVAKKELELDLFFKQLDRQVYRTYRL